MPKSELPQYREREGWRVCMEDTHGLYLKHVGGGRYLFAEITDMVDACGRDNAGKPDFAWDITLVSLRDLPEDEKLEALRSCFSEDDEEIKRSYFRPGYDEVVAECCHGYGSKARLDAGDANTYSVALREALKSADACAYDLDERLDKPQNAIGSTGHDLLRGDVLAGLKRAAEDSLISSKPLTGPLAVCAKAYAACGGQTLGGRTQETIDLSRVCTLALSQNEAGKNR